jgi:anthranilate phosphoribosyltransferase
MSKLITASRFADPDAAYVALVEAHRGLSAAASVALNTRLVLVLANHIGDLGVLQEAIALAKRSIKQGPSAPA